MDPLSRIAIVGHSDLVTKGLQHILESHPEYEVVLSAPMPFEGTGYAGGAGAELDDGPLAEIHAAAAGNALAQSLRALPSSGPADVPVILLGLPSRAADIEAWISEFSAAGRVICVGELADAQHLNAVMRAGANGCVSDLVDAEELLLAIRAVARGGMHVSPSLSALLHSALREPEAPPPTTLAPRETETLGWLAVGLTHREIAKRRGLTEATVSTYVKRIRGKLNARNMAELTRVAIELGLLDLEHPMMRTAGARV